MEFVIFNGEIKDWNHPAISVNNRAFRFGDGVFETLRAVNGKVMFVENHFSRMTDGLKALKITIPPDFTVANLRAEINSLLVKNNITDGGRIRITAYRNAPGYYLPRGNDLGYIIEASPYEFNEYVLNREGLMVDTYTDFKKQITPLSSFKTLSCQIYIMASLYGEEKDLDEVFLVNNQGNIIEAANSNVFVVSNRVLYTPSLSDGCMGGTMRMNIINLALDNGLKVYECALTPQNLLAADEIFLTNAIRGVQWVGSYRMKRYFHKTSDFFIEKLNQQVRVRM